jgi:hypothetical protein
LDGAILSELSCDDFKFFNGENQKVAIERTERVEPEATQTTTTSVVLDRDAPDYLGSWAQDEIPKKGSDLENLYHAWLGLPSALKEKREHNHLVDINLNLSPLGRKDAKENVLDLIFAKLAPQAEVIKHYDSRLNSLEAEVSGAALFKTDDPIAVARQAELRSWFSKQPRGGIGGQVQILQEALESGNDELLAAIVLANPALKIIGEEMRAALIEAVAFKKHPEKLAELAKYRKAVAAAKFGLNRVAELLYKDKSTTLRERLTGQK